MKILGLDTTTQFLCLGIYDDDKVYAYTLKAGHKLSSLLGLTIKRVLDALGWRIGDIDYFACGLGPGSFTGIRIGMSTIKGLAWSAHKPIVGIPTLDILAKNVKFSDGYIAPVVDAKRNLIYASIYKMKDGSFKRTAPYMLLAPDEFYKKVKNNTIVLGDALALYKNDILKNIKGVTILDSEYWYPKAGNIIDLALERIENKKFDSPFKIKPIYLYPKECQIRK